MLGQASPEAKGPQEEGSTSAWEFWEKVASGLSQIRKEENKQRQGFDSTEEQGRK